MSYNSPTSANSYNYGNNLSNSNYNNGSTRQRKISEYLTKNRQYQSTRNDNDSSSFLRNTMGSYKSRPNYDLFQSSAIQTQKKSEINLRHTTGNLSQLLKNINFDKQYKEQQPIVSKKYAETSFNQESFKKDRNNISVLESKPSSKYNYQDSKVESSSRKNYEQILNKLKRQKELDDEIRKLKEEKEIKLKSKTTSSLSNLIGSQNVGSYSSSSYSPKQTYNKNPQDLYSSYRKNNETVGQTYKERNYDKEYDFKKKYEYDFSKKTKVDYSTYTPKREYQFDKKYEDYSKKYDTNQKKEYDWKKSINVNSPSFLSKNQKSSIQTKNQKPLYQNKDKSTYTYSKTQKSQKKTSNLQLKQDKFSQYFSPGGQKGQKFDCKVGIKDFKLGKALGQGKFGTVYQAVHKPTNSLYALKKVPKSIIKSHYMIDQFILELKLQTFMNHQNLLALHGFFHDTQNIYLILDYMQEGTLYSLLKKKKKLQINDAALKIKQIAKGIIYMHQNGIAHRDLKPENVVMSYGSCKLCDFGWSTICDERRKTYCGTFDYAAPQILEGTQYDMSVDLWCLGVLSYELLVGKAPFYHIKKEQTKKKILNVESEPITFPNDMSKDAVDFIDRLLKKDPQQRIKVEDLLTHPFLVKI